MLQTGDVVQASASVYIGGLVRHQIKYMRTNSRVRTCNRSLSIKQHPQQLAEIGLPLSIASVIDKR